MFSLIPESYFIFISSEFTVLEAESPDQMLRFWKTFGCGNAFCVKIKNIAGKK